MTQGFYTGLSGIQTHQYGIDVVSDNLANVNTIGYRGSNTEFASLLSTKITSAGASTPTSNDIEVGVRLQTASMNTTGGAFLNTDRFNDLAIGGNGWFGVMSGTKDYFTRAGDFVFDEYQKIPGDGNSSIARLTTGDGMYVTGTMLGNYAYNPAAGSFVVSPTNDVPLAAADAQGPLEFPTLLTYPAQPTTVTKFAANLGFAPETRTMSADAISANNDRNRVKLVFTQSAVQPSTGVSWDIAATVTSNDGQTVYDTQSGQAIFGALGILQTSTLPTLNNDGAPVTVDLLSYLGGITSSAGVPITASSQSDGTLGGTLTKYGISSDGTIIADFSNGRQSAIGRVAVYHFQNEQGLDHTSGTLYSQSSNSGKPTFWTDKNGNPTTGATINAGHLENSNVRLDVGLTDMIILQRAYQANAKTITTVDEMIQKALQMRR
ncbi:MAG: flagellar hook-basal body complex protein [Sulfuricurvum sp.]|jgi:flagellar hook protein FlgE